MKLYISSSILFFLLACTWQARNEEPRQLGKEMICQYGKTFQMSWYDQLCKGEK